jgi:hypothetical protein
MRVRAILLACGLGVSISACDADRERESHVDRARETPEPQPTTFYEHEDRRNLPIGTRVYYERLPGQGYAEVWVRPGQNGPPGRKPDVVIIK